MNGSSNSPFTDYVTKSKKEPGAGSASGGGWIAPAIIALLVAACGWFWYSGQDKERTLQSVRSALADANTGLSNAQIQSKMVQEHIATLEGQIAALEKEKEQVAQKAHSLEDEMRAQLESKDVTISQLQGKLTVNILDRVLFNSGEAALKPGGEDVLHKVATLLETHKDIKIHVIGHTDNVPIHTKQFPSNWELSTARAMAAVHFLTEKAGFDPRRVGAVGYGEFRPIADNSTEEGRAKNRRIAITILSDELAGADTATPAAKPAPTQVPVPVQSSVPVPQPIPPPQKSDVNKPALD